METAVVKDICLSFLSYPWSHVPPFVVEQLRSVFVTMRRSDRPRTHIAEMGFVLGRILDPSHVISTSIFIWFPLSSYMGLLGWFNVLGWVTGLVNTILIVID